MRTGLAAIADVLGSVVSMMLLVSALETVSSTRRGLLLVITD